MRRMEEDGSRVVDARGRRDESRGVRERKEKRGKYIDTGK